MSVKITNDLKCLKWKFIDGYGFVCTDLVNESILSKTIFLMNCSIEKIMIKFYYVTDKYGAFSNFARYPIRLKNKIWPTSEHYYQAQKYAGTAYEEEIRLAEKAIIAFRMGNDRGKSVRTDWEAVKDDIMREAVRAKFSQHPELRELLLSTGNTKIVEHTKNDSYWGDGGDGSGKNMLGIILMEVREELQSDGNER